MIAKGVPLPDYDILEQVDILEAEKRNLMIEFGKGAIQIMATAKDKDHAIALIDHLKKIFFVDEEKKDRVQISRQADELIRLGQLTYRITPKAGRASLEITKE